MKPLHAVTAALAALPLVAVPLAAGCASSASDTPTHGIAIVAAENFWGSIAAQLAGDHATVHSLIVSPAQDPHSYEPTAADARALATANFVILNGVGYDAWASKLLAANPTSGRLTLNVGRRLGLSAGENPHRWYDPADVREVATTITADLIKLDPEQASYFKHQQAVFENHDLARYDGLIAAIRARYEGVPVGASESIFALQAPALGLHLITPYGFLKATSEGTEVTAQDTATAERQISQRKVKVWIYNSQNATPAVQRLTALARGQGIPVVSVTETLSPASDSFEQWQTAQLERIERALQRATGR
jgi:zinc/manganese transport system substrate-binding protein